MNILHQIIPIIFGLGFVWFVLIPYIKADIQKSRQDRAEAYQATREFYRVREEVRTLMIAKFPAYQAVESHLKRATKLSEYVQSGGISDSLLKEQLQEAISELNAARELLQAK